MGALGEAKSTVWDIQREKNAAVSSSTEIEVNVYKKHQWGGNRSRLFKGKGPFTIQPGEEQPSVFLNQLDYKSRLQILI